MPRADVFPLFLCERFPPLFLCVSRSSVVRLCLRCTASSQLVYDCSEEKENLAVRKEIAPKMSPATPVEHIESQFFSNLYPSIIRSSHSGFRGTLFLGHEKLIQATIAKKNVAHRGSRATMAHSGPIALLTANVDTGFCTRQS